MRPLIETGSIWEERSGSGRRMVVRSPEALRRFLVRQFPELAGSLDWSGGLQSAEIVLPRATPFARELSGVISASASGLGGAAAGVDSNSAFAIGASDGSEWPESPLVFISYSSVDEELLREFENHLAPLKRDCTIRAWHSGHALPGDEFRATVLQQLQCAHVAIILVSSDYFSNDALYEDELSEVVDRARAGGGIVVAVIVRACLWEHADLEGAYLLPQSRVPVKNWDTRDDAWAHVAREIRDLVVEKSGTRKNRVRAGRERKPEPTYETDEQRELARRIDDARRERAERESRGEDVAELVREIIGLTHQFREGGRLHPGDALGDGRYRLLEEIGKGGSGTVWRAVDRELDDYVAVKVLHPEQAGARVVRERFERGARVMASLGHRAVVRVLAEPIAELSYHYYVMELAEGGDLERAVAEGSMSGEQVMAIVLEVGDALATAHVRGFVHRDVKPANIVLSARGEPRLTDFDQVRADDTTGGTRTGAAMGTYLFMAPEQLRDAGSADARADVYALGVTVIFCLHRGQVPNDAGGRLGQFIAALSVDGAVKMVLRRAVKAEPAARYPDGGAFCVALRAALSRRDKRGLSRG